LAQAGFFGSVHGPFMEMSEASPAMIRLRLLVGALLFLAFGPAFISLPPKISLELKTASSLVQPTASIIPSVPSSSQSGVALSLAAALLFSATVSRRGTKLTASAKAVGVNAGSSFKASSFAGSTLVALQVDDSLSDSKTAVHALDEIFKHSGSLKSCRTLYFRNWFPYRDRYRKVLRNRAYNLFMENRYKRYMRRVIRWYYELVDGKHPDLKSLEEVMAAVKPTMDDAFNAIDFVTVQGVLHRKDAAKKKARMCDDILRACIELKFIEKPKDPFMPSYKTLGYEVPRCFFTREPRPWQLPGWKSPWMLKREYSKWRVLKAKREVYDKEQAQAQVTA
jgi:ribosomal protein S20